MASRLGEGIQRGRTGGGFGAFFQTLGSELSKAKERREKEDIRIAGEQTQRRKEEAQLEIAIEKIIETGKQSRKTQAEKPLSIKERAFQSASKGEALEGFTLEETKRLGGTGVSISGDEAFFKKFFNNGKDVGENEDIGQGEGTPGIPVPKRESKFTIGQVVIRGKKKFKVIDIDDQGPVFEEVK